MITTDKLEKRCFAGIIHRLGAYIIDIILISIISKFIYYLFNSISVSNSFTFLIIAFIVLAYKLMAEWKYGGSLGKYLLKFRLVDHKFNDLGFHSVLIRNIPYILVILISVYEISINSSFNNPSERISTFVYFILALTMVFSSKKQAVYDILAKSFTVKLTYINQAKALNQNS